MGTPGFFSDGIDFDCLVKYYRANNNYICITDSSEIKLATELMEDLIAKSYGYDEDDFVKTIHGRFQILFNSNILELTAEESSTLIRRSNSIWRLNGSYETGADFVSTDGVAIETKVYKNILRMRSYAEKGSSDYTVFHGAKYVLCYLLNSHNGKHWHWLAETNGKYTEYDEEWLNIKTAEQLPPALPMCYCKLSPNRLILGENTYYN